MSGICGIIHFNGVPIDPEFLSKMIWPVKHRGPDGINDWHHHHVGLAHLALNITPESTREQQPLAHPKRDIVLTADARIDNRAELIPILLAKGYLIDAQPTDADIILAAYQHWGTDCPAHLLGDFAFAIWDGEQQQLFAARDPMAMRAFYYRVESQRVLFGTEVKQILAVPDVPTKIFEPMVGAHLAGPFGFPEWTFYEGIAQLAPAHALLVNRQGHRTWQYWDVDPDYRVRYRNEQEYAEHFREIFADAVRVRLRSRKPVGIMLSGGTDSGSTASMAGWLMQQDSTLARLHPYCYAFKELAQADERFISDKIIQHYGFSSTDVWGDDLWPFKDYPEHGPDQDDPFISYYQVLNEATLAIAQQEGMGTMIRADRGDEVVGDGVVDYLSLIRLGKWKELFREIQTQRSTGEYGFRSIIKSYFYPPLREFLVGAEKAQEIYRSQWHVPAWIKPDFAQRIDLLDTLRRLGPQPSMSGYARRWRYSRIFMLMGYRIATLNERTHAKFGLGYDDPWSDRRLASYILAMPQSLVNQFSEPKRLARRAMQGIIPEAASNSISKITDIQILHDRGVKEREREVINQLFENSVASRMGYMDSKFIQEDYNNYLNSSSCSCDLLWPSSLEMWLEKYF